VVFEGVQSVGFFQLSLCCYVVIDKRDLSEVSLGLMRYSLDVGMDMRESKRGYLYNYRNTRGGGLRSISIGTASRESNRSGPYQKQAPFLSASTIIIIRVSLLMQVHVRLVLFGWSALAVDGACCTVR